MEQTPEKVQRLQVLEENLRQLHAQRQQAQAQLLEIESAQDALQGAQQAFRIIGSVMVERPAQELREEQQARAQKAKARLEAFEKHEARLKAQADEVQQDIVKAMGEKDGKH